MFRDLSFYGQAHGRFLRIFNNLAISYDQAHGTYAQAHGQKFERRDLKHSKTMT